MLNSYILQHPINIICMDLNNVYVYNFGTMKPTCKVWYTFDHTQIVWDIYDPYLWYKHIFALFV